MNTSHTRSTNSAKSRFQKRLVLKSSHPRLAELVEQAFALCAPPPDLTVSQWADRYRYLSREDSAEPGKWNTARAEYQRGIMDAISDPAVEEVVCMKGSQIGWTAIIGNMVGYHVHQDPAPILVLQPTVNLAKAWSKDRLAPMLRDTPALRGKVKNPRSRDSGNTILHKEFPGGHLTIIGANAPAELASRPIRIVLNDEVDRYPVSAGTEGDPQKLAEKRQETFWNRKRLKGSTPTIKDVSAIERDFEQSDKRRFFVPCRHCGTAQDLRWEQVKWDKDEEGNHRPETAHYQCEHCGQLWTDAERWEAISKGEWKATAPFSGVAGFHLSQLYSPWVALAKIVKEFLVSRRDPSLLQVFVNTVLAETFEEQGETVEAEGLRTHVENYDHDQLPDGVWFATAGVDVQGDRLEAEIVGWGEGEESWGIRYEILYGDPAQKEVWGELDDLLLFKFWTECGRLVRIRAAAVDMGGHHGDAVLSFCEKRFNRGIYPIRGQAGPRPVWPKLASKTKDRRKVWMIGVDTAKDSIYGRYKIEEAGPGYCHLPTTYHDEWFDQATSEKVVTRYRQGRPYRVWVPVPNTRQEGLDCRVYAYAARMSLSQRQAKPSQIVERDPEARNDAAPARPTKRRRVRSKGI